MSAPSKPDDQGPARMHKEIQEAMTAHPVQGAALQRIAETLDRNGNGRLESDETKALLVEHQRGVGMLTGIQNATHQHPQDMPAIDTAYVTNTHTILGATLPRGAEPLSEAEATTIAANANRAGNRAMEQAQRQVEAALTPEMLAGLRASMQPADTGQKSPSSAGVERSPQELGR